MKKKLGIVLVVSMVLLFGVGISLAEMPSADPAAIWTYISKTSPYHQWQNWPDHQGIQQGRSPHGILHHVFVNQAGLSSAKPPVSSGTMIVKDNFNKRQELKAITVMYKVKGYNPVAGDWFWVKFSPTGKVAKAGKPRGCIGCHAARERNDFILLHEFK